MSRPMAKPTMAPTELSVRERERSRNTTPVMASTTVATMRLIPLNTEVISVSTAIWSVSRSGAGSTWPLVGLAMAPPGRGRAKTLTRLAAGQSAQTCTVRPTSDRMSLSVSKSSCRRRIHALAW
jgi:hypothetical protein